MCSIQLPQTNRSSHISSIFSDGIKNKLQRNSLKITCHLSGPDNYYLLHCDAIPLFLRWRPVLKVILTNTSIITNIYFQSVGPSIGTWFWYFVKLAPALAVAKRTSLKCLINLELAISFGSFSHHLNPFNLQNCCWKCKWRFTRLTYRTGRGIVHNNCQSRYSVRERAQSHTKEAFCFFFRLSILI